ncbi:MAG TPA: glucose 1-dehydrogenase [Acidimicrobiales bacterium]|nr:glucose 1-dehydrogenase [Acidimicrobiales bacterium]
MSVAIVTGGSRGIGAATCELLAAAGHDVVVGYQRKAARADEVVRACLMHGVRAIAVAGDVSTDEGVAALFAAADDLGALGVLVNNVGIVDVAQRVDEMSTERVRRMFEVNVLSAFMCAREASRRMARSHGGAGGAIVNVGSVAASVGSPNNYVDYAASKAAIDTLTLGLAKELAADGVRVNCVRPGITDTEIHASGGQPDRAERLAGQIPMQRAGEPVEIARAIVWLCSDEASYVTGAILDVSGGR